MTGDHPRGWPAAAHRLLDRLRRVADSAANAAVNVGFAVAMRVNRRRYWPPLVEATDDPARAQAATLRRILAENAETTFGRQHGFDRIDGPAAFRDAVPVQDYETLRPLIENQELTGTEHLTADRPVIYAQTSGTSGRPKYIPLTEAGVGRVARAQRLFASAVHAETDMFRGKIVGIGSPAVEGHLPGGSPFGSASGMVYEQMPSVVRRKYVLEPEVLAIDDHDARYEVIAALCLAERGVSGVATANPSTLLRLRSVIVDRWDDLVAAVGTGRLTVTERLDPPTRAAIARRLRGDAARAAELRALGQRHGPAVGYRHIWPGLAAITTWTGGSAGFALAALQPHLDPATKIVELGYSASEVRGTVGIDPADNRCVPLLDDNWYEFVDRSVRQDAPVDESGRPALAASCFLGIDELEPGGRYYVYVTTFDGLYRYDMNDIVEVTGRFGATPTLAFVQKGRGVTNITGEKLAESQVLAAVDEVTGEIGSPLTFFVLLADEEAARYRLYVEYAPSHARPVGSPSSDRNGLDATAADGPAATTRLAALVDQRLQELNIEYGSKRASGRLGPMAGVAVAPGTADAYRASCVAAGQRDAQFKFVHLQYQADCGFDFDAAASSAVGETETGGAR